MLEGTDMVTSSKKGALNLPNVTGVYIFLDKNEKPVYIGKAKNLKSRVSSYFLDDVSGKAATMVKDSEKISYYEVNSELEALLLEAKLVRKYQPKYNSELKDDKHSLYIKITKEQYPRILTARKIEQKSKNLAFYGPFPSSGNVYTVLKMLKRIFAYANHQPQKRPCLHSQIGLCNPCPSLIEQITDQNSKSVAHKRYKADIRMVRSILDGKTNKVKDKLRKEMYLFSQQELFEEAAIKRDQLSKLDYITQPVVPIDSYLKNPNFIDDIRQRELESLLNLLNTHGLNTKKVDRIECYDVAHTSGSNPTASMVTFIKGQAEKRYYRHFKIKQKKSRSDTDSMREIINRRLKHLKDWGRPDLVIVDGGKAQVSVFFDELSVRKIPVIGIAKATESLVLPFLKDKKKSYKKFRMPSVPALHLVQRLRDEAHRFARRYHHKLIQTTIRDSINDRAPSYSKTKNN